MRLTTLRDSFLGEWTGEKRLWLEGAEGPFVVSAARLTIAPVAKGTFLSFTYTWACKGVAQEGLLLLGNDNDAEAATAAWVDSWHMSGKIMACRGEMNAAGTLDLLGSFEVPPGPNWGWRIVIARPSADVLQIQMYSIDPDGKADIAVQIDSQRIAGGR